LEGRASARPYHRADTFAVQSGAAEAARSRSNRSAPAGACRLRAQGN